MTAESLALTVAERLLDPKAVTIALSGPDAASLTHGLAGTSLLHARLSCVDPVFSTAARRHWAAAASHLRQHPTGFSGIQGGQGGLAASLIVGSAYLPDGDQHDAAAQGTAWLAACARDIASRYRHTKLPTWDTYDAITGLAGIGRVLLAAHDAGYATAEPGLQAALTTLTTILAPTDGNRPGWWLPAEHHPTPSSIHPTGAATTGLAHGVAGPLMLLSVAHRDGYTVPGQTEAIEYAASWLVRWQRDDGTWPPSVTGLELGNALSSSTPGRQHAWCYGTPGISRALAAAADALDKPHLHAGAADALDAMAHEPAHTWDVEGPTLCHGQAGVLASVPNATITEQAASAVAEAFEPTMRYGFRHSERHSKSDNPGLLIGAAGVALALADNAHLPAPMTLNSGWKSLLLLS